MNSPPPRPRSRHRLRRIGLWLIAAVVFYALVTGIALPVVVLPRLEATLTEAVGRPVSIQRLWINPLSLGVTLDGVEADDADGSPFLRCRRLSLNLQISSLIRRGIVLREVHLSKPYVHVIVDRRGELNLAALPLVKRERSGAETPLPPLWVAQLEVDEGEILFTDLSRPTPFHEKLSPIHVAVQNFSTLAKGATPYAFRAAAPDGDSFEWEGMLSMAPFRAEGRFHAVGTLPETVWRYLQDNVGFAVGDATVEISANYALQRIKGAFALSLDAGALRLRKLSLTDRKSREVVLSIPSADFEGASFDLASHRLSIASLSSRGGTIRLQRSKGGTLRLPALFTGERSQPKASPAQAESAAGSPAGGGSPLDIRLAKLSIEDYKVDFEDHTTTPPAKLEARKLSLHGRDLSTSGAAKEELKLALDIASGGRLEGRGKVSLAPLGGSAEISVDGLGLEAFQPYLSRVAKLDIAGGTASLHGRLTLASEGAGGAQARLRYEGAAVVDDLGVTRSEGGRGLVGWKRLDLDGTSLAFAPDSLAIQKVVWKDPELHLRRGRDGSLDTSWWLGFPAEKTAPTDGTAPGRAPSRDSAFPIRIANLEIEGGTVSNWDASVQPPVRQKLTDMDAAIEGLASPGSSPFQVHLEGMLNGEAPVAIQGTIGSPLNAAPTRVELKASNYGLTTLNPYTRQYLGQAIDRGKLAVTATYRLDGSDLHSDNHLVIDQLALGERVETPEGAPVPVGLAMALLRNRNGKIELDVSVHGDLSDPGFSYRDAFARAFANVITKVASTPFSVLGSLVGEGPELGYVVFSPGSDELQPDQAHKVDALAKALEDRPRLRIEVRGTASATVDGGNENRLLRLARRRAVAIRRKLVDEDGIDASRVYLLEPALRPTPPGATHVRTELSITAG